MTSDGAKIAGRTALVADDHGVYRMALAAILKRDCGFQTVLEAGSLDDAVQQLGERDDITFVTFDLGMPGMESVASLQSIREVFPHLGIAVVTASEKRDDMIGAIFAGVHGYITKTLPSEEIAAALNSVLKGNIFLPWSISQLSTTPRGEVEVQEHTSVGVKLTTRQSEVLNLIRLGKSNKEIARALGLTENTIKVHTNALYRALGVRNRVSAASIKVD
jgi:DNA-binding NarL/FixJ family response regulator